MKSVIATLALLNLVNCDCTTSNPVFSQSYYTDWKTAEKSNSDLTKAMSTLDALLSWKN